MSIKLGLALLPEIELPLDVRSVCTSDNRPEFVYNGQLVYETDTMQFVYYNGESWVRLFDALQTDPFVQNALETIGSGLSELRRRIDDSVPDVYQRIEFIDARSRQMKDRIEELETMIVNNEQRNEQLHQRIESFIGRLNAVENAHNNNDNGDNTNDDPPPLALF